VNLKNPDEEKEELVALSTAAHLLRKQCSPLVKNKRKMKNWGRCAFCGTALSSSTNRCIPNWLAEPLADVKRHERKMCTGCLQRNTALLLSGGTKPLLKREA
jgi:hypothetical protein